jgi:hypothetical protein
MALRVGNPDQKTYARCCKSERDCRPRTSHALPKQHLPLLAVHVPNVALDH